MTKEKFLAYESVRESGATNMFDIRTVIMLAGEDLTKEDCLDIMQNYKEYKKEFGDEYNSEDECTECGAMNANECDCED